ncbi:hypothetical protein [Pseudomonas sp. Ant30-3]|uniref:hypothetical protein n=1 Tax=Pseudomonas sp. Ant30-3 TaxID=1488328 RepID=UPI0004911343|nr:hypothetical protein [Pseudomonas sp. Ant30-3]
MTLSVRKFTGSDGERHAMLMDEAGMPLFYPALWVTVILRGGARAVNTIHNALSAIKCLYAWQDVYVLDVEERFSIGALLKGSKPAENFYPHRAERF